jgi:hypothetical protein
MTRALLACLLGFGAIGLVFSCADGGETDDDSATTTAGGSGGAGGSLGVGAGGGVTVGTGGSEVLAGVWGESDDTLYKLDPTTNTVSVIGMFNGCDGVLDIAVDKDNNMFGTTLDGVYAIDKDTAACSLLQAGTYPLSLSFVPEGTLDPNTEVMVGYDGADYVRIDTSNGTVTTIGALSGGFEASGDIVSVIGGSTYLTVKFGGCNTDCLLEVDPVSGDMITNWGEVGYTQVFGLAYWGGTAYGFTNAGELFSIEFGSSTVTTALIAIPNAPPGLKFWGAGSSTAAPLVPPS